MNLSSEKIIKYIKYLIYGLVIAVPLIYFPTIMMPFQLSKTILFQILAEIIFTLWVWLAIFNKSYRPKFTPIAVALSVFMTVITLSGIFGPDWRMSFWSDESRSLGIIAIWHFFALFLSLSSLKNKIDWNKIWTLSFWTAVAVSLIGMSQLFFLLPKDSSVWLHIIYVLPDRIGSTFSNPAFMAGYLLINFFIGLYVFVSRKTQKNSDNLPAGGAEKRRHEDYLLLLGTGLILIAIFLSQTLAAILGLGVGAFISIIYFIFKSQSQGNRKISVGLLIAAIIFGGVFWFTRGNSMWQKIPGVKRVAEVSLQGESIQGRLITWKLSLKAFKEKPVFGWGFENFRIPFDRYYDPSLLSKNMFGTYWDKPHNVVLEYLVTTGIIGLLAYLGIIFSALFVLFKKQIKYKVFFIVAILAYFVQNLFIFDTIGTYLMLFLLLAFIDSYSADKSMDVNESMEGNMKIIQKQNLALAGLVAILLVPVYYNYQIFTGANYEYWGVNYFLNRLPESSLLSFNKALMTPTPYIDDIRRDFANTVKQAYQQGIAYSSIGDLQGKLANHLRLTIKNHPQGFLGYVTLAEFENVFYKFNNDYLDESERLSIDALELSPKRQQALYVLGKVKLLKSDTLGAYKVFEEAVNANVNSAEPHFYFALAAYSMGNVDKGAAELAEAERLGRGPQKIEEFVVLGNYIGDLNHDYKKAISYYGSALDLLDRNIMGSSSISREDILLKLAIAYYFDHNYIDAKKVFLEASKTVDFKSLSMYPDLKPVLQELGIEK